MILNNYYSENDKTTNSKLKGLVDKAFNNNKLTREEMTYLVTYGNKEILPYLQEKAVLKRQSVYGNKLFIRGLIEISNICEKDCLYCGIRRSNKNAHRYRYDVETIERIIDHGYKRGYRTFVMQGGEDAYYTDDLLVGIIKNTKAKYDDIAITLSIGERSKESYQKLYDAGADRFLLRHETSTKEHYEKLHPESMKLETRLQALDDLKEIGFQTGAGFMVDSPYQDDEAYINDLMYLQDFQPQMVGIGPYLNHHETPFANMPNGDINHVLFTYALVRLLVPKGLIPSTTATSSLDPDGRYQALKSGCNVIMINLSDMDKRQDYTLYENKSYKGDESDDYIELIAKDIERANMEIDFSKGNHSTIKGE